MASISDGFRDVFLAGVGAMALGAEKSKELIDQLISKGESTVDQGKELNAELTQKAAETTTALRDDLIAAHLSTMSKDERDAFAAKIAEMAAAADEKEAALSAEAQEVEVMADTEETAQADEAAGVPPVE